MADRIIAEQLITPAQHIDFKREKRAEQRKKNNINHLKSHFK